MGGSQERKQASWVYIRENRTICPFGLIALVGQIGRFDDRNGTICPFWRFILIFIVFLRQNWTFTLQNVVFLECGKGLCSEVPKPHNSRNAYKTREIQQDHTWSCRRHWLQNWPNMTAKREKKKKQKDKCFHFRAATRGGGWGKKIKAGERGKGRAGGRGKGRG